MISIARDYTTSPGARYKKDGPFSGEDFREKILEKYFRDGSSGKIIIDLDDVEGYSTAFLEEAFGGLVRLFGKDVVENRLEFISNDEPLLVNEIKNYLKNAKK
jgi:hypothetical protein